MTPGQEALREAMRAEQARTYGKTQREHDMAKIPGALADELDRAIDARRQVHHENENVTPIRRKAS